MSLYPVYLEKQHARIAPRQPRPWVRLIAWFARSWRENVCADTSHHKLGCRCHVCREEPFR